jgi:hypothetical protein
MKCCPTCGRPYAPDLTVTGPVRGRLVDIVANRPDGLTRDELFNLLYAEDANGGPDPNVISVLIYKANCQLRSQGYRITVTWMGRGARYKLVKIDGNTVRQSSRHRNPGLLRGTEPAGTERKH